MSYTYEIVNIDYRSSKALVRFSNDILSYVPISTKDDGMTIFLEIDGMSTGSDMNDCNFISKKPNKSLKPTKEIRNKISDFFHDSKS